MDFAKLVDIQERRQKALTDIQAGEEKSRQALQEYKTREEKEPETGVQRVCSSSSQNSFMTGEELKDDDKIVIFFFEESFGTKEAPKKETPKGECYLLEELETAYKASLEEREEDDGSIKIPVCEWDGPPAPYGRGFSPYGRDPNKPVFRLPFSGAWVSGETIEEVLKNTKDFPIVVNLTGERKSIGSYFGASQLHGQWGGQWTPGTDEKGNTIAVFVKKGNAQPDEREIVYRRMDINKMFLAALHENEIEKIKMLLENEADVHYDNEYALNMASDFGYTEIVRILLENGADVHTNNDYSLRVATEDGNTEIVRILLENGADVHADDDYSLWRAATNGYTEIVKLLIQYGANINVNEGNALYMACVNNHIQTAKLLLENGATINDELYELVFSGNCSQEIIELIKESELRIFR